MNVTKEQLIERMQRTTKQALSNVEQTIKDSNQLVDPEIQVLAEAILCVGTGITDALTDLTLVLSEALLKEETE